MNRGQFFREFSILAIFATATTWILSSLEIFKDAARLSWFSLFFFLVLTVVIYLLGHRSLKSRNINSLTQLILAMVMIKLLCCAVMIVAYKSAFDPRSNLFVIPFLILYLIFTSYEVLLFNRLNRASSQ